MTAGDDDREMSREELQRVMDAERVRSLMTAGDKLRAVDLAAAVSAGDVEKVLHIVIEADTAGETIVDGLARTRNLLLAYVSYSRPLDLATLAQTRKRIVDEELTGMANDEGSD